MKKVTIIGSGFGGLSLAIRLQSKGFDVTVFEKNEKVGGHAYQLKKDGYTFDMGPSLITAPDIIQKVFESAGRRMEDYLDLIYLDPFYRIYFHDKSYIDYNADADFMKKQMAEFNPKDAENFDAFMEYTRKMYDEVITNGLGAKPFTLRKMIDFMPKALGLSALKSTYSVVSKYFKDPRNRFTFSFHPLFIGGSPFRSPAVYLMIPYLEKHGGVWFSKGGMYSLVEALEKVFLEIGGKIHTNSEVDQIVVKNGNATGVMVNKEYHQSDIVVSNAHFAHTHLDLIDSTQRKKWTDSKLKKTAYSMSSFLMYMGVRKKYPQLKHHTLILSERYKELVKDIFDRKVLADDFSMYLHAPSITDPDMAPKDSESMYVLIPVPNLLGDINWHEKKHVFAKKVLDFLENDFGLEGLQDNLDVLELFTPEDFKTNRNNYLGSAWGVEPKLTQSASFRPANKSEDVENLYMVGASTHPGAGVPGVLLTAEATEYAIINDTGELPVKLNIEKPEEMGVLL
jgi:phytoene desaturase